MGDSKINKILVKTAEQSDDFLSDESFSFNVYKNSNEIAKLITESVMKDCWTKRGFVFDSSDIANKQSAKTGLVSNVMGLSTLLELNDMETDVDGGDTSFVKYIDRFQFLIQDIFKRIYLADGTLNFDATPYLNDKSIMPTTYVETISKTLIAFTDLRAMLLIRSRSSCFEGMTWNICGKEINGNKELLIEVERLMVDCMNALCKACLKNDKVFNYKINGKSVNRSIFPSEVLYKGWAYQDFSDEESTEGFEPALYFTYHATNAIANLYSSLERVLKWTDDGREGVVDLGGLSEEETFKVKEDWIFYNQNKELINKLRIQVSSSGRYFEQKALSNGVDLAFDWVDKDLKPLPYDFVNNGQKNNCIIDTLFLIALYFNADIDEDYKFVTSLEDSETNFGNVFYETIDYSLKNIQKAYFILKRKDYEDIVSTYILLFNEKIPVKYRGVTQKLRMAFPNVKVYDLVPLLCNTYFLVAEYMVNYPQIEMQKFLNLIIENMHGEDWYWSADGFNVNNNLYYIFALENFYDYYNTYEAQFIENGQKCYDLNREISRLNAEILEKDNQRQKAEKEKKEQIEKLQSDWQIKLDGKVSELDAAVNKVVDAKVKELIKEYMYKYQTESLNAAVNTFVMMCHENERDALNSSADVIDVLKDNPDVYNLCMIAYLPQIYKMLRGDLTFVGNNYHLENHNEEIEKGIADLLLAILDKRNS